MTSIEALLTWLPPVDFAVLAHGWAPRTRRPHRRAGHPRFVVRLVCHELRWNKVSDDTATISQVHIPLNP